MGICPCGCFPKARLGWNEEVVASLFNLGNSSTKAAGTLSASQALSGIHNFPIFHQNSEQFPDNLLKCLLTNYPQSSPPGLVLTDGHMSHSGGQDK